METDLNPFESCCCCSHFIPGKIIKSSIDELDRYGYTFLHYASMHGHLECIEKLISLGSDINKRCFDGNSALHYASKCEYGDCEDRKTKTGECVGSKCVKFLILNGALINLENNYKDTPLFSAIEHGCLNTIKILVKHGADINLRNRKGETPLYNSVYDPDLISFLLLNGANINAQNENGKTALHRSIPYYSSVVKILIDNGVNTTIKDNKGRTPLDNLLDEETRMEIEKYIKDKEELDIKTPDI